MFQSLLTHTSGPALSYQKMVPLNLDNKKTANSPKIEPTSPSPNFLGFPETHRPKISRKKIKITTTLFLLHHHHHLLLVSLFLINPKWRMLASNQEPGRHGLLQKVLFGPLLAVSVPFFSLTFWPLSLPHHEFLASLCMCDCVSLCVPCVFGHPWRLEENIVSPRTIILGRTRSTLKHWAMPSAIACY